MMISRSRLLRTRNVLCIQ